MSPQLLEKLSRIAEVGIELLPTPELAHHFVFWRDGCVVLVERRGEGFGGVGSPGLLCEAGFAALVERGGKSVFLAKGLEMAASEEQSQAARRLLADVRAALE